MKVLDSEAPWIKDHDWLISKETAIFLFFDISRSSRKKLLNEFFCLAFYYLFSMIESQVDPKKYEKIMKIY